jgi:hypothetical protein
MSAPPTLTGRPPAPEDRAYRRGLALSGAAFAALILLTGGGVLISLWLSSATETAHASPAYDGVTALKVSIGSGTLEINADRSAGTRTTVASQLRWSPRTTGKPTVSAHRDGGVLTVDSPGCAGGFGFHTCQVALTIAVPPGLPVTVVGDSTDTTVTGSTGTLRATTESGGLTVRDATAAVTATVDSGDLTVDGAAGPLNLRTSSGDVRLSGASGDLTARVDSGDFTGTELSCPHATVASSSGGQLLEFAAAPSAVHTTADSGNTRILVPGGSGPYAVTANVDSGDRTVQVDNDQTASRTIDASTSSGDLVINYRN